MSFIDQHIGRAVRDRREALAMTENELAAVLCIPTEALQRQETGELHITLAQLRDLTHALGVSLGYLFKGAIAEIERVPCRSELVPPTEQSDAVFLLSFVTILYRMAGTGKLARAEYYLDLACQELQRSIAKRESA